jgi:hypothetical protein
MRMARGTVGVACAVLACATLVACGDDSGSSDSGGGSSASDNAITVKASEYKFDVSGELTAGYSQITLENDGKQPHELIAAKLKDGKTAADALPILEAEGEPDPAALAEVFDGDPTTAFYGTPGPLAPSDHQTTVSNFTEGTYVFVCFFPSPDGKSHVSLGMLSEVTVGAGDNTTAPETKGTFTITDDSITVPDDVSSGTYAVTNSGEQPSSFATAGPTDKPVADFDAAFNAYFATIGTGETPEFKLPAPLTGGFSDQLPPGGTGYVVFDLDKGHYLVACNSDDNGNTLVSSEFDVS